MKPLRKIVSLALIFTLSVLTLAEEKPHESMSPYEVYRLTEYIRWYPAIEQQTMMGKWLEENELGAWTHSGRVGADDRTVITPQADVNYGYSWFNVSDGPMIIELPAYGRYSSLSIFDMNHFIEDVIVDAKKPIVVRLASQKAPVEDSHEVIVGTNSGLAFLRMVIPTPDDEADIMALTEKIRTTGGAGSESFIIPDFTAKERAAAMAIIKDYSLKQKTGNKLFGKSSQGIGDLDRAAGVFLGQLGIPSEFVQYTQYVVAPDGERLGGQGSYTITVDPEGMIRDQSGYWSITVYNMEDRYLIQNSLDTYSITSYTAIANSDGSYTVRINPDGVGENAIPTVGKTIYAVMRVYQPVGTVDFPTLEIEDE